MYFFLTIMRVLDYIYNIYKNNKIVKYFDSDIEMGNIENYVVCLKKYD